VAPLASWARLPRTEARAPRRARGGSEAEADAEGGRAGSGVQGWLRRMGSGVKCLLGLEAGSGGSALSARKESAPAALGGRLPSVFGLMGTVVLPLLQLAGGMFREAQDDVDAVREEARTVVARSGRLGSGVESGPTMNQSCSSMSVNGQRTSMVEILFRVKGSEGAGLVSCGATIGSDGKIELHNLKLNSTPIETVGAAGDTRIIDV